MQLSVFADKTTKFPNCGTKDYFLLLINCDLRSVSLKLSFIPTQSSARSSALATSNTSVVRCGLPGWGYCNNVTVSRSGRNINTQCCKRNSNSINLELNNDLNAVVSCFPVCRSRLK